MWTCLARATRLLGALPTTTQVVVLDARLSLLGERGWAYGNCCGFCDPSCDFGRDGRG